jgi:hypothetical protein
MYPHNKAVEDGAFPETAFMIAGLSVQLTNEDRQ